MNEMNGTFYPNAMFPNDMNSINGVNNLNGINNMNLSNASTNGNYVDEQSYIENILRLNRGKKAKAFFSFPDSNEWRDKVFEGVIEQAGKDHLIMSDPATGKWQLILLIYLNFVEFDEPLNYNYPYANN